ncbi:flagellar basal-body rod protein FlgF [Tanticharoenia sakaeratensis]|jgi:flagellar basal-body rod protein FlgF|uniref:Flagellar basal-body rod protein FlgF n=1 Tax=Tanticharoenia sakaeratensis NBRC 103193 TaxID=1231623 RepID=A0A0D6MLL9_9PROT|nr:flagellar basal-body rod protein FlgF [Tanticharoenia sakaeratensis]GAN54567.1 flagellar basal-body rod protein FlgF [Tanticharoenia sakaeratensis NBRC 103193]GBQ24409.1 flagellar basal body rod protein FlgF [Tanticharoenia sakaeratensis NBRC 103193]
MENATYIALSRLDTEQRAMSVVANNLANASTAGFKGEQVLFSDYLSRQSASGLPPGGDIQSYTQDRATFRDTTQGEFQQTGNPLDVAIGGDGYFQIRTDHGVRLTRSGRFERLTDGTISDESGNAVLDTQGNPIRLNPTDHSVTITSDGTIETETGIAGQIGIVTPADENRVHQEGGKLLRAEGQTTAVAAPKLMQGALEASNVKAMTEMTRMMDIQRNFQFIAQFVESEATRQQDAISKIVQNQS